MLLILMQLSIGSGADEEDAVFITKSATGNVRVGINNTNPEFDLTLKDRSELQDLSSQILLKLET